MKADYRPSQQHYDPNVLKTSYQSTYTKQPIMQDANFKETYEYVPRNGHLDS